MKHYLTIVTCNGTASIRFFIPLITRKYFRRGPDDSQRHHNKPVTIDHDSFKNGKLKTTAEDLRRMRHSVINEQDATAIASDFSRRIGPDLAKKHAGTGELLLASVADDINGIESVADDLRKWMTDTRKFSDVWIAAVTETLTKARKAIDGQSK